MKNILKYFEEKEWSMGNGQCPECCGVSKKWHGHPLHLTSKNIGHKNNCKLAKAMKEAGGNPLMKGDYRNSKIYEICTSKEGFLITRLVKERN